MNPLLVNYNKHYNTHVGNRNYAYLKTIFNCDALSLIVQPQKVKKITRESLKKMGSIYWHILAGQSVFPVQVAVRFKIPLIVWGAHQGLDQVGMFSHEDEVEMSRRYRKNHDLMGFEAEDLIKNSDLSESDIVQYLYPHDKEIEKVGVRGIYLGNYIPWDTKAQHEKMIEKYGYETTTQQRTFDTYNDIDCVHYNGLHDYIKYLKYGYGKITDHATREIRWGRLSRDKGIELVERYEHVKPTDIKYFLKWAEISENELFGHIKRDNQIWTKKEKNWQINDHILHHRTKSDEYQKLVDKDKNYTFICTPLRDKNIVQDGYTLLEKGFVL
jgi:N-acetyl sugar amidotransferase